MFGKEGFGGVVIITSTAWRVALFCGGLLLLTVRAKSDTAFEAVVGGVITLACFGLGSLRMLIAALGRLPW